MIVKKLRPWVSSFSEAIVHQYKHGDAVCVGGEIVNILNMAELLQDIQTDQEKALEDGVYLTLDDGVGINTVVVPLDAYKIYQEEYKLQPGMVVLAEGRVFNLVREHKGRKMAIESSTRILAWKIMPVPDATVEPLVVQDVKEEETDQQS